MDNLPGFESCFLITTFVEKWMIVYIVDVDEVASFYNMANNSSVQWKSHLTLL